VSAQYIKTHPWLTFTIDLRKPHFNFWLMLGECQSNVDHLAGVPLRPDTAEKFYNLYLAKGVRATTAIEGNTLSEEEVLRQLDHKLELPPSREYLKQEIDNVIQACTSIAQEVIQKKSEVCSVERIKEFNREVLNKLQLPEGVVPGEISAFNVTVGRYRAAPRADCNQLLEKLCTWLNGKSFEPMQELNLGIAVIKAVLSHLYLAWIHPFGDGNGRTARLLEFDILLNAGVPAPAAHLLSNHYNATRDEYYRQLDYASKSGGDVIPFLSYAVQGFRDGLREQLQYVRQQQRDVAWRSYIQEKFRDMRGPLADRQRHLVLDLSRSSTAISFDGMKELSTRTVREYANRSDKTLIRDLQSLEAMELIKSVELEVGSEKSKKSKSAWIARKEKIDAFLPPRKISK
jgi:Fic family protein